MHPILVNINGHILFTYGLLVGLAYFVGVAYGVRRATARGLDPKRILTLGIYVIFSAIVGAKLMLLATRWG